MCAQIVAEPLALQLTSQKPSYVKTLKLNEPVSFNLTSTPNQSILIEATQHSGDIRLSATSCYTQTVGVDHQSDIPSNYRQSEFILLKGSVNPSCTITVSPSHSGHHSTRTTLTLSLIHNGPTARVYEYLARAGEYWAKESGEDPSLLDVQNMYTQALYYAKKDKLVKLIPLAQFNLGIVFHFQSRYEEQASMLLSLLASQDTDSLWALKAKVELANYYLYEQHKPHEAKKIIEEVFAYVDAQMQPLVFASALEVQAGLATVDQDYQNAITAFFEAHRIYLTNDAHFEALNTLLSGAYYQLKSGDYVGAVAQYKKALSYSVSLGDEFSLTNAHIKLATTYLNLGMLDDANEYIAVALQKVKSFPHSFLKGWAFKEKARIFLLSAQPQLAEDYLIRAQQHFENLKAENQVMHIAGLLGSAYTEMGQFDKAQSQFTAYIEYAQRDGLILESAAMKLKLIDVYLQQNKISEGAELLAQVKDVIAQSDDAVQKGFYKKQLAILSLHNQNLEAAEDAFLEAEHFFSTVQGNVQLLQTQLDFTSHLIQVNPEMSLSYLQQAIAQVNEIHTHLQRPDFRRGFFSSYQSLTSRVIGLDKNMTPQDSLLLAETMKGAIVSLVASNDRQEKQSERQADQALFTQLGEQFVALHRVENEIEKSQVLYSLRQLSEKRYAYEAERLKTGNTDSLTSPDFDKDALTLLQSLLDPETLVVFVDTDPLQSHLWYVSNQEVRYKPLPREEAIADVTGSLEQTIQSGEQMLTNDENVLALSNWLFSEGLTPSIRQLIVIGDGPVETFPLSILIDPETKQPLINTISVARHFSLKSLLAQLSLKHEASMYSHALVVSNPATNIIYDSEEAAALNIALPELPYAEYEASLLGERYGLEVERLVGQDATKQKLLTISFEHFDIIHFATHGISNTELPELGGLVLAATSDNPNVLIVPEIKTLKLNAKLVVLSGCETADGAYIAGEGMLGLSRAFYETGARNVIGSLWKVRDDATAFLMNRFYGFILQDGLSYDDALRKAKQAVRDHRRKNGQYPWKAPIFWAGFELHGSGV
ncbi:hypothetical protein D210916BOD24_01180 [Alteromonas sp. D210916BOD_24]